VLTERTSGVLLHPTSLPTPYPLGSSAAHDFIDFLAASGQRWWQMLPIGPPGDGRSPYQTLSSFAGNPLLLSPHQRPQDKKSLTAFDAFVQEESPWLDDYTLFSAIREKAGTADWTRWTPELRTRQPAALARVKKDLSDRISFHAFVQWQFALQWQELKSYCSRKGIGLIGDVPIFVAPHSADVWAHPDIFKLDDAGKPVVVAGVPPDYFSKTGQLWGNPVYRWDVLRRQGYGWWIERLRMGLRRFDVLRLDHFIGFVRAYEVPAGARTALNGQYRPGPGAAFFDAVRKSLGSVPFIAEDLGAVTPEVIVLRDQLGVPGMRVLQFEFEEGREAAAARPDRYAPNSVVYTGTHDNDTTAGWFRKLPVQRRKRVAEALKLSDQDIHWAMIRLALTSRARTAIIPMQDLLGLGTQARMNLPGTAKGNWRWRLSPGYLTPTLAQRLRQLTKISKRQT